PGRAVHVLRELLPPAPRQLLMRRLPIAPLPLAGAAVALIAVAVAVVALRDDGDGGGPGETTTTTIRRTTAEEAPVATGDCGNVPRLQVGGALDPATIEHVDCDEP